MTLPAHTLHSEFTSNGVVYNVDTTRETDESAAHWKRRHEEELEAAWLAHEPD